MQPHDPAAAIALGIGYLPEERRLQGIFASKALENNLISNMLQRFTGRLGRLDFAGLGREARRVIDVRTKTEIHGFIRALAERAVRWR